MDDRNGGRQVCLPLDIALAHMELPLVPLHRPGDFYQSNAVRGSTVIVVLAISCQCNSC